MKKQIKLKLTLILLLLFTILLYFLKLPVNRVTANGIAIPKTEEQHIEELIKIAFERYHSGREENDPIYRRDQHTKGHGCVKASFIVLDDIPEQLKFGVFDTSKRPTHYESLIRFSNAAFGMDPDQEKDARGMSIKLLGVDGDKLLYPAKEKPSQDFILMNHPVFLIRDVEDYLLMGKLGLSDTRMKFFFPSLNPFDWRLGDGWTALGLLAKPPENPVATDYFSIAASMLGTDNKVKYVVKPCAVYSSQGIDVNQPNFLRSALENVLQTTDVCFSFMIQSQNPDAFMPVEDLTIEWSENEAPYVPVAQILIPKQTFNTEEQNQACEDMSFNPWHSLEEHKPIGGLNRVRKAVYQEIARYRRTQNGVLDK